MSGLHAQPRQIGTGILIAARTDIAIQINRKVPVRFDPKTVFVIIPQAVAALHVVAVATLLIGVLPMYLCPALFIGALPVTSTLTLLRFMAQSIAVLRPHSGDVLRPHSGDVCSDPAETFRRDVMQRRYAATLCVEGILAVLVISYVHDVSDLWHSLLDRNFDALAQGGL